MAYWSTCYCCSVLSLVLQHEQRLNQIRLSVDPGKDFFTAIQFRPRAITIDNISSQWLYLPKVDQWIPPYFKLLTIPYYDQGILIQVDLLPNGLKQSAPNVNNMVSLLITDEPLPPSSGTPYSPIGGLVGLFTWDQSQWDVIDVWSA